MGRQPLPFYLLALFFLCVAALGGCTREKAPLGSKDNPIKLFFVPSVDAKLIEDASPVIKKKLEELTGYHFRVAVPASYVAVVEAFGTHRADVSALNTFGYLMAHDKYGAEARLTVIRYGQSTYRGQIIARADSGIERIEDIDGKTFAYVDAASTSGFLLPRHLLQEKGVQPAETVFAGKHDNVVSMVYQRQVDAGATFYSPPEKGQIQDARRLVLTQYPDVEEVVKIVALTQEIPNDPIVLRKEIPEEMKKRIVEGFVKLLDDPEGRKAFHSIYSVTGLQPATDADYDGVRTMLAALGESPDKLMGS